MLLSPGSLSSKQSLPLLQTTQSWSCFTKPQGKRFGCGTWTKSTWASVDSLKITKQHLSTKTMLPTSPKSEKDSLSPIGSNIYLLNSWVHPRTNTKQENQSEEDRVRSQHRWYAYKSVPCLYPQETSSRGGNETLPWTNFKLKLHSFISLSSFPQSKVFLSGKFLTR